MKVLEENMARKISDIPHSNIFTDMSPYSRDNKEKNKQMGLHQFKNILHRERKYQQDEKETNCMGKYICQ